MITEEKIKLNNIFFYDHTHSSMLEKPTEKRILRVTSEYYKRDHLILAYQMVQYNSRFPSRELAIGVSNPSEPLTQRWVIFFG